jgi:hypothetical protein
MPSQEVSDRDQNLCVYAFPGLQRTPFAKPEGARTRYTHIFAAGSISHSQ